MEAGRELDALVTEKVMRFVWDEKRCRVCGWPIVADGPGCWADNCSERPMRERHADEPAPYSTDIRAAWSLVEKCNLSIDAAGLGRDGKPAGYWVGHHNEHGQSMVGDVENESVAFATTAPHAICLAALKWAGVEVLK